MGTEPIRNNLYSLSQKEKVLLQNVLYAEAGWTQPHEKKLVIRTAINRTLDKRFPDNLSGVLTQPRAFSCMDGNGNILWRQANKKAQMSPHHIKEYLQCSQIVEESKEKNFQTGLQFEDLITAYHDRTVNYNYLTTSSYHKDYWSKLVPVIETSNFIFYADRNDVLRYAKEHKIQSNDTAWGLSKKYHTKPEVIRACNPQIGKNYLLKDSQKIKILANAPLRIRKG